MGDSPLEDGGIGAELAQAPFEGFALALFKIDDAETGEVVDMEVNAAQQIVLAEIRRQERANRPVRCLVLKGRQQGMSTLFQAFIAWKLLTRQRIRCAVVGHELGAVGDLFAKVDTIIEELPDWYEVKVKQRAADRQLRLAAPHNSVVRYDSAHDPSKVGRGGTRQLLHLTETPQWADEQESMQAVLATVRPVPGTYVFVETTAKGASGWFYEQFVAGMKQLARGEDPYWFPIFVPWFKTKEYQRRYRKGERRLSPYEQKFKRRYKLTTEQVLWYRDREAELGPEGVREEYPSNWREAFLYGGRKFLRKDALDWMDPEDRTKEGQAIRPVRIGRFRQASSVLRFEQRTSGPTHVFELPHEGHRYTLGLDFAGGRADDFSAIVVIDWDAIGDNGERYPQVVATHQSKLLPHQVLVEAIALGKLFNDALIVPDRTGMGEPLVTRLVEEYRYPNVYLQRDETNTRRPKQAKYGYAFSGAKRMALFEEAAHDLHLRKLRPSCQRLIQEWTTFVYTDGTASRAEAEPGQNDDLVCAHALAKAGLNQLPRPRRGAKRKGRKPHVSSGTGY